MDMATRNLRGSSPPDFLVKLLAMVQSEDPKLIAWNGGKVFIQDPLALEKKMSAYFRHSNFSSFQRQLNNFGFRKVEGKGKLAPCMYMHDDLQGQPPDSLLRIRRKAPTVPPTSNSNGATASTGSWQRSLTDPVPFSARIESKRRRTDLDGGSPPAPRHHNHGGATGGSNLAQKNSSLNQPFLNQPPAVTTRTRSFDDVARDVSFDGNFSSRRQTQQHQTQRIFSEPPANTQQLGRFHETTNHSASDNQDDFPPPSRPTLSATSSDNAARRDFYKHHDSFESGLLLSFLENDPASHLPPNATAMKFFDPATEALGEGADADYCESQMRVNIFGKQHRLNPAQRAAANGVHG